MSCVVNAFAGTANRFVLLGPQSDIGSVNIIFREAFEVDSS